MERLFIEGKDLLTVIREYKKRKSEREAQLRLEYAEQQRVKAEAFARFESFCEANGL